MSGDFVIVEGPLDAAGLHALMREDASWEAELDAGAEAMWEKLDRTYSQLSNLRCAAGLARRAPNAMRADIEGPSIAAVRGEIRRLERWAWELLETPDEPGFHDERGAWEYGVPSCLEVAEEAIAEAWRILAVAIRSTRCLRARMGLALSLARVGVLRARIAAHRSSATSHTPSHRSRTGTVADVVRSLTQAAHAPPRVALYRCPAIAGGGPL